MTIDTTHDYVPQARPFAPLPPSEVQILLEKIPEARIAVLGDYCLDVYWFVDPDGGEPSLETGLKTRWVREQRYALGGAGNVVANLVAMGCRHVQTLGVIGDDPWGREQVRLLTALGVDTDGLLVQADHWSTLAYNKPHIGQEETHRFDFGNFNRISEETTAALLSKCRDSLPDIDAFIINQQVREGIHSDAVRAGLTALIAAFPEKAFIADSRHFSEAFVGAHLKINEHEAARLCGMAREPGERVLREEALAAAATLHAQSGKPVVVTRGPRGMLVCNEQGVCEVPGIQVLGRTDTVGAGDSVLAGLSLGLAIGSPPDVAAQLGNFAAAVTIRKLNQTGAATPDELLPVGRDANYVYRPELAEDPRCARFLPDTEFEMVTAAPPGKGLGTAIFDHDGTLSVLREGWEKVMEPMMTEAILGPRYASADESLYHRAVGRVRDFIDKTTGIQTLVQMQGLVAMVREFGCVPEADILDEAGYKKVYNEALMAMVRARANKLTRGELAVEDFAIKNAVGFLRRLSEAGVRLFLASGTDQEDVEAEARAMGYAHLFTGGIHGATADVTQEAKRIVLDRILNEIGPGGAHRLVTFGDGPVEIRETIRRGGYAIGVASDEIRRFGLNPTKRTRLIRAGADMIVPDFSQADKLIALLL